ncbi:hypothetical protein M404DRAFT_762301 [Pisolithus tinctorius Marx 270]|uniref:Uncharacterized protein n=1 Tax=Pisolithus tinctorius Marx 270 TaxID=870435 RepID=A0A0C3NH80_PISTI|nr:hypothetical protein M404DRAFT_762301 [Pisolithus tinctorius Marx 270]
MYLRLHRELPSDDPPRSAEHPQFIPYLNNPAARLCCQHAVECVSAPASQVIYLLPSYSETSGPRGHHHRQQRRAGI